jgi:hypothetical protein
MALGKTAPKFEARRSWTSHDFVEALQESTPLALSCRLAANRPTPDGAPEIGQGMRAPSSHKPQTRPGERSANANAVRLAKTEIGDVLQHGGVAQVLGFAVGSGSGRREMENFDAGHEDTAAMGGQPQAEIQVFAAHPKIGPMKAHRRDCFSSDEQTNSLSPDEVIDRNAEPTAVFAGQHRSLAEPVPMAIVQARQPAYATIFAKDERIRSDRVFAIERGAQRRNGIRREHGIVIEDEQVGELAIGDFPCVLFREPQSTAATEIGTGRQIVRWDAGGGRDFADLSGGGVVADDDGFHARKRTEQTG